MMMLLSSLYPAEPSGTLLVLSVTWPSLSQWPATSQHSPSHIGQFYPFKCFLRYIKRSCINTFFFFLFPPSFVFLLHLFSLLVIVYLLSLAKPSVSGYWHCRHILFKLNYELNYFLIYLLCATIKYTIIPACKHTNIFHECFGLFEL